jgi:hypothetical protein
MTSIIKLFSNRPWLTPNSISKPEPVIKTIPEWYRKGDKFAVDPLTNEAWIGPDGGKMPTWKACPAIFDVMGAGYALKTPCDLEFYLDNAGVIQVRIENPMYQDFCHKRPPMPQFQNPHGYHPHHFAWYPDWSVGVPEGYSVLYTQPMNRFELPFLTTSGIIDNDVVVHPGMMPFFLSNSFVGVIPAGTVYAQMLPFKRDDWESETVIQSVEQMAAKHEEVVEMYRVPNGGAYKDKVWKKRSYK